jgi:DNA-directed RNA polymerase subunit F
MWLIGFEDQKAWQYVRVVTNREARKHQEIRAEIISVLELPASTSC